MNEIVQPYKLLIQLFEVENTFRWEGKNEALYSIVFSVGLTNIEKLSIDGKVAKNETLCLELGQLSFNG